MAVNNRRLMAAVATWSIVAQFVFICSGEAYRGDDFFFHDQPSNVVRRSVDKKPIKVSDDEIILNDMANVEGSGSGDESDGEVGSGSGDGENLSSKVESHTMTQESTAFDQTEKSKEGITTELSSITFATTRKPQLKLVSTELSHTMTQEVTVFNQTGKTNEEITTTEFSPTTRQSPLELMSTEVSHIFTQEVTVLNQTEKINEAMTTEINSITFSTTRQPRLELVSIVVCGKRYYCPKGSRGPCLANEILVEENESNNSTEAPSYCSALHNYPWKGCLSQVSQETDVSSLSARCSLKSTKEPCSGLPSHYRYDPARKICRPASNSTGDWLVYECGDDQFYVGLNRELSSCRCLNEFHLIYKANNKCYHPFTRGPCDKGMWLEPSSRREANCSPSPCLENQIDGRHFYWKGHFHGPAGCYRTNTRGPCPEDSTFVVTDYVLGHVRCRRNWNVTV